MHLYFWPRPYAPRLEVLSDNTLRVSTGRITVAGSPNAQVLVGSIAGNQVTIGRF